MIKWNLPKVNNNRLNHYSRNPEWLNSAPELERSGTWSLDPPLSPQQGLHVGQDSELVVLVGGKGIGNRIMEVFLVFECRPPNDLAVVIEKAMASFKCCWHGSCKFSPVDVWLEELLLFQALLVLKQVVNSFFCLNKAVLDLGGVVFKTFGEETGPVVCKHHCFGCAC